ncbi:hypothetical protein [Chengkuizengella axinellae]|uniref:Uncharacterized protein n=1 Tax=Chengkuizengella axinellae TaxID=3064388 RepID=A0ABT9IYC1_9BACL|nr:hypothetical protein [Chengkuizengella sp. 2205SS18-9]MDP5274359.1 hypothetical protein [Chengkuizengella sp. 2205SS18-9]
MDKVIISRSTKKVVALNRSPQPFEYAVENVYTEGATKTIHHNEQHQKFDDEGNTLYLLPQPQIEINETFTKTIETTEITDDPVMTIQTVQIPKLDDDGNQKTYEKTVRGETVEVTEDPVIDRIYNEETEEYEEIHKTDEDGNSLYWGQVPTGQMIPMFTTQQVEVHKSDEAGNQLYYKTFEEITTTYEDQPPLEIIEDHEEWTEELELAFEEKQVPEVVSFKTHMTEFDENDIFEIQSRPVPKSETDILGEQIVEKDIQIMQVESLNQTLGQQIVELDIRLMQGGL